MSVNPYPSWVSRPNPFDHDSGETNRKNDEEVTSIYRNAIHKPSLTRTVGQKWLLQPMHFKYDDKMAPLQRNRTLRECLRRQQDWAFQMPSEGAFGMILRGSALAKRDFVIGIVNPRTINTGFFVLFRADGAQILRQKMVEGYDAYFTEEGDVIDRESTKNITFVVPRALEKPGDSAFNCTYENGVLRVSEGFDPNEPGKLLLEYRNEKHILGLNQFTVGMYGNDQQLCYALCNELEILDVARYHK